MIAPDAIRGRQTGKVHCKTDAVVPKCRVRVGGNVYAVAPANARRFGV